MSTDTTARIDPDRHSSELRLLVVAADHVDVVVLEDGVDVVVGRGAPADLVIDAVGLSRRHVRLRRQGRSVDVEDLGSRNGTVVVPASSSSSTFSPLPAGAVARVGVGDTLQLGDVRLHVLGGASTSTPSSSSVLITHEQFLVEVEREARRARVFQRPWSWALVRVGDGDVGAASQRLAELLRPVDVAAIWAKDVVELLLPELDAVAARSAVERVVAALADGSHAVAATWPTTSTTTASLLGAASAALSRHTAGVIAVGPTPRLVDDDVGGADDGPVAVDPASQQVFATVRRLARSPISVLVSGETGVGKEVVATALHQGGDRSKQPLVVVNCGALPANLVESTLFGHERGAFTGADTARKGAFEQADGGTLFLDEIGDLPLAAQVVLLRTLESRTVRRIGGQQERTVDVRVVAASHKDLVAAVAAGAFREDLLYRLNTFTLDVSPLRARRADIVPLARRFLDGIGKRSQRRLRLDDDAAAALQTAPWPGNVRELRNVLERAAVLADSDVIGVDDVQLAPVAVSSPKPSSSSSSSIAVSTTSTLDAVDDVTLSLPERVDRLEAELIHRALRADDGDTAAAALRLGVPRRTLQHRIKLLGVALR